MDCSLPGSSVCVTSQARMLEYAAISFSRGSSQPRDWTHNSCIGRQILYHWATRESPHSDKDPTVIQWFEEEVCFSPNSPPWLLWIIKKSFRDPSPSIILHHQTLGHCHYFYSISWITQSSSQQRGERQYGWSYSRPRSGTYHLHSVPLKRTQLQGHAWRRRPANYVFMKKRRMDLGGVPRQGVASTAHVSPQ